MVSIMEMLAEPQQPCRQRSLRKQQKRRSSFGSLRNVCRVPRCGATTVVATATTRIVILEVTWATPPVGRRFCKRSVLLVLALWSL